jgi:hypothetical protein
LEQASCAGFSCDPPLNFQQDVIAGAWVQTVNVMLLLLTVLPTIRLIETVNSTAYWNAKFEFDSLGAQRRDVLDNSLDHCSRAAARGLTSYADLVLIPGRVTPPLQPQQEFLSGQAPHLT